MPVFWELTPYLIGLGRLVQIRPDEASTLKDVLDESEMGPGVAARHSPELDRCALDRLHRTFVLPRGDCDGVEKLSDRFVEPKLIHPPEDIGVLHLVLVPRVQRPHGLRFRKLKPKTLQNFSVG